MADVPNVTIVCAQTLLAEGLRHCLEGEGGGCRCRLCTTAELQEPAKSANADVLFFVPQSIPEIESQLKLLEESFAGIPAVFYGDLRFPGMCLLDLPPRGSTLVSGATLTEAIPAAVWALREGKALSPVGVLEACFIEGVCALGKWRPRDWPSGRELQYGCGVSLGLTNLQIKPRLGVSHGTVKTQVHNLRVLLEQPSREELGHYIARVLVPMVVARAS